jgi:hypothetical protein
LHNSAADKLAAADADVDDALKGERKAIGGMFIECLWDQGRNGLRGMVVRRQKAVEECWVLWRGWREAKVVQHAY